jgi:hypothetical protein
MAWEMPSRSAKRMGSHGLRVEVFHPFTPAWKAKVALGSVWAVSGFEVLQVSFWARAERPDALPALHVDVTDIDEGYQWLGYAPPCQLSYTEWRQCVAPVPLTPARKGHALDISIVVGDARGVIYIDDVLVLQRVAAPPSPPRPPPPAPPLAPTLLALDFETLPSQPWPPPEPGSSGAEVYAGLAAPVHARALPAPFKDGGDGHKEGKMVAQVPSASGLGREGSKGAHVSVQTAYHPAWRARLELGTFVVQRGLLTVSFYAKAVTKNAAKTADSAEAGAPRLVPLPVDVSDVSDGATVCTGSDPNP